MRKILTWCKKKPLSLWVILGICFIFSVVNLIFEFFGLFIFPAFISYTLFEISIMNLILFDKPLWVIDKIQVSISYVAGGIVPMIFWRIRRCRYIPIWKFIVIDGSLWAIFVIITCIEFLIAKIAED